MLRILVLLFVLFPHCSNAQLPLGKFAYNHEHQSQSFTFKKGNRFEYYFFSCTGGRKGVGTYTFKDSILKLYFETQEEQASFVVQTKFPQTNKDSSHIYLKLFDPKNKKELENGGIIIKVRTLPSEQLIYASILDTDYIAFNIANIQMPIRISIYYLEFQKEVYISERGDYEITCPIKDNFIKELATSDTLEFVVSRYNKNEIFIVEDLEGYAEGRFKDRSRQHPLIRKREPIIR